MRKAPGKYRKEGTLWDVVAMLVVVVYLAEHYIDIRFYVEKRVNKHTC